jgi:hypothetical protein
MYNQHVNSFASIHKPRCIKLPYSNRLIGWTCVFNRDIIDSLSNRFTHWHRLPIEATAFSPRTYLIRPTDSLPDRTMGLPSSRGTLKFSGCMVGGLNPVNEAPLGREFDLAEPDDPQCFQLLPWSVSWPHSLQKGTEVLWRACLEQVSVLGFRSRARLNGSE